MKGPVTELERDQDAAWIPMQWRGSNDGVTWTPWTLLPRLNALVDVYVYYQARILIDGGWQTSPVITDVVF